jgi:hypothetical protein
MRATTEDVRELMGEVERLKNADWNDPPDVRDMRALVIYVSAALETVVNCLRNANDRIDALKQELAEVRRSLR